MYHNILTIFIYLRFWSRDMVHITCSGGSQQNTRAQKYLGTRWHREGVGKLFQRWRGTNTETKHQQHLLFSLRVRHKRYI